MHQVGRVTITHRFGEAVRNRKSKSGALKQGSKVSDLAHGQHAGGKAPGDFGLGFGQAGPKFVQGLTAEQEAHEEPVWPQGTTALHQLANRIVGPMQAKAMQDKIVAFRNQIQNIVIWPGYAQISPDLRKRRDGGDGCKGSVNLHEPLIHLKTHFFVQKELGGAAALPGKGCAITKGGRRLHGAEHGLGGSGMQAALHLVYPPQCLCCDERVTTDFALCGTCWKETPFVTGLVCDLCGTPLPGQDDGSPVFCDDCLQIARPWSHGRAGLLYRDRARDLVLQLKHADRVDLARPLGAWLHRAALPILEPGMLVAPVPLHWVRLFRRRYNQAALLSAEVARLAGLEHCPDLLRRLRNTGSQEGRSRDERFTNLVDAFALHPKRASRVEGRHILIVDDVMTSGATFAAAAEACLANGAMRISVLALARVAKDA